MAFFFFFTNIALFLITQITNGIRSFEWCFVKQQKFRRVLLGIFCCYSNQRRLTSRKGSGLNVMTSFYPQFTLVRSHDPREMRCKYVMQTEKQVLASLHIIECVPDRFLWIELMNEVLYLFFYETQP